MNVKEENICRLCLKIAENDFQIIDEIMRKILFEVLLIRVNLNISKDPIICKDCAEVVEKCYNFKSTCIDTEGLVFSFTAIDKRVKVVLKDEYKDRTIIERVDDNCLCQFCSNYLSGSDFVLLDTLMNDVTFAEMLRRLMPEMDFDIIKNPIICTTCKQDLECYMKFVEICTDVEEKITKYLQNEDTPSCAQVKLSEILGFLSKNTLQLDYTHTRMIKQEVILEDIDEEHCKRYDDVLIKTEEGTDIKYQQVNFNEIACKTPSESVYKCDLQSNMTSSETEKGKAYQKKYKSEDDKKTIQMISPTDEDIWEAHIFKCAMCTFETKYKNSLKRHTSIHKDITEVKLYNCSTCTYETKYKFHLKSHMLIHKDITEVRMYKCSMCTYETKNKGSLKSHILIHKDFTEVIVYKCSMCTYKTKIKSNLKNHMLIHKDNSEVKIYKCSMCTFETKLKGNLKKHMVIHKDITEVETYKCSMCTYKAKRKGDLKSHMLIHKDITAVEVYKCSICSYMAKRTGDLKSHMLIHKDVMKV